jgi:hypothetical protein
MRNSFLFIAFLFLLEPGHSFSQHYRWDIKTLTDTSGQRVLKNKPVKERITDLANPAVTPRPGKPEMKPGVRARGEKKKVFVAGTIIRYGLEDDRDYHLVVASPEGDRTLIAEIPDPDGPGLSRYPELVKCYRDCRKFIDERLGRPSNQVKPVSRVLRVKITGVVFFDKLSHGKGHAENGAEIHPVLHMEMLKEK